MIDAFALLDQPRRPWLDDEKLRAAYHAKTRATHPDAKLADTPQEDFAEVNEAFHVLGDPRRRLQHLLTLEGDAPPSDSKKIPADLFELFPETNAALQNAKRILEKTGGAQNELGRALLQNEIIEANRAVENCAAKISQLHDETLRKIADIDRGWSANRAEAIDALAEIYLRLTFLGRWKSQLDEKLFELGSHTARGPGIPV